MLLVGLLGACAAVPPADRTWPATLRAGERWELVSEVDGVLLAPLADAGERAGQGQVIGRLNPEPFDTRLAKAEQAMAVAQAHWRRVTDNIDPEQLRVYSPSITTALDLGPMRIAVLEAEIRMGTAATELRHARWALQAAQLVTPRPGRVSRWLVAPGTAVAAGESIVQLEDENTAEVVASVSSSVAKGLRRGGRAEIFAAGGTGHYQAIVHKVGIGGPGALDVEVVLRIVERARPPRTAEFRVRFLPG